MTKGTEIVCHQPPRFRFFPPLPRGLFGLTMSLDGGFDEMDVLACCGQLLAKVDVFLFQLGGWPRLLAIGGPKAQEVFP